LNELKSKVEKFYGKIPYNNFISDSTYQSSDTCTDNYFFEHGGNCEKLCKVFSKEYLNNLNFKLYFALKSRDEITWALPKDCNHIVILLQVTNVTYYIELSSQLSGVQEIGGGEFRDNYNSRNNLLKNKLLSTIDHKRQKNKSEDMQTANVVFLNGIYSNNAYKLNFKINVANTKYRTCSLRYSCGRTRLSITLNEKCAMVDSFELKCITGLWTTKVPSRYIKDTKIKNYCWKNYEDKINNFLPERKLIDKVLNCYTDDTGLQHNKTVLSNFMTHVMDFLDARSKLRISPKYSIL
jgi:hypothetical protein